MALIDRIKFDGFRDGSRWLVYKYPGEEFVMGSQLIVGQGQCALFVKGGEALDLFMPGTYTLKTENLPLLKKIVKLPFGGRTPFTAEVYFINTTAQMDIEWGTATPIQMEDPKYGIFLSIRSYGNYGMRIADPGRFIHEIVGSVANGMRLTNDLVENHFRGLVIMSIKTVISAYMIKSKISFLEISAFLQEISLECQEKVMREFGRFGVKIENFFVQAISPGDEDYAKLREYKEELALGGDFYRERRQLDIMEKMASNPAQAGAANAAIGLGMGMGMASAAQNMFSGMMQSPAPAQNPAPAAAPAASDKKNCPHCNASNPAGQKFCGECGKTMVVGNLCPHCGSVQPLGQKFCGECGKKIAKICPDCSTENDITQKFCGGCGKLLSAASAAPAPASAPAPAPATTTPPVVVVVPGTSATPTASVRPAAPAASSGPAVTTDVNSIKCPNCYKPVSMNDSVCSSCHSEIIIRTLKSVKKMASQQVLKYTKVHTQNLEANPDNADLNLTMALCYLYLRLYDKAQPYFEKAIEDNFDNSEVYLDAAICLLKGKKAFLTPRPVIDQIEEYIQAAIKVEETRGIYYYFWAYIRYDHHNRKSYRASPSYTELLAKAKRYGTTPADIADLYETLGVERPSCL